MVAQNAYRIMTINPGSTSTKIGVFDGDIKVLSATVEHSSDCLSGFKAISDQLPYRRKTILDALKANGIELSSIDAFVGRGGGLLACEGGTYRINETLLKDARRGANGVRHPAQLGPQLAAEFAAEVRKPAFVVNPPDTDELCDDARITGIRKVYRHVHLHALNLKETAIHHAVSIGRAYEECNFIVCHLGGGISISAHRQGKMIDGNDIVGGEGPLAPTRCGSIPVVETLDYLGAGHKSADARALCMKRGGFVDLLGTSDAREVRKRANKGDAEARRAWNAMVYQVCKWIGAMAATLEGNIDGILLSGGMVHDTDLVKEINKRCGWIAPVSAYPGEFELEAMAAGAIRVLSGEERFKIYSGIPVFTGFDA